jgi:hypothetical protein
LIRTKTAIIIIINNEDEIKASRRGKEKDEPISKPRPANNCKIAI